MPHTGNGMLWILQQQQQHNNQSLHQELSGTVEDNPNGSKPTAKGTVSCGIYQGPPKSNAGHEESAEWEEQRPSDQHMHMHCQLSDTPLLW